MIVRVPGAVRRQLVHRRRTVHLPDGIDGFVTAAHTAPLDAERELLGDRKLAQRASTWDETGLQAASHCGHRRLVGRLVQAGASLDVFAACVLGDLALIRRTLPQVRPDVCGVHGLPLTHFAVMSREVGVLEFVLSAGVEVNPAGASLSPLHTAVAVGSEAMAELLIAAGADPEFRDAFGRTAEDWAVRLGRQDP